MNNDNPIFEFEANKSGIVKELLAELVMMYISPTNNISKKVDNVYRRCLLLNVECYAMPSYVVWMLSIL